MFEDAKSQLQSQIIVSAGHRLVHAGTGEPVRIGDTLTDFRGDTVTAQGGKYMGEGSTGRVHTDAGVYFPNVFGLRWVQNDYMASKEDACHHCHERPVDRSCWDGDGFGLCRECDAAEPAEGYGDA